jgi:hypothetical protein
MINRSIGVSIIQGCSQGISTVTHQIIFCRTAFNVPMDIIPVVYWRSRLLIGIPGLTIIRRILSSHRKGFMTFAHGNRVQHLKSKSIGVWKGIRIRFVDCDRRLHERLRIANPPLITGNHLPFGIRAGGITITFIIAFI